MCGIAGFFDHNLLEIQALKQLDTLLEAIAHRGPDARGQYWNDGIALGHNRLSIIDLSETANQPMFYLNYVMVFNGEIYNYLELGKELINKGYQFSTQSDSEVVMAAFAEWGAACVDRFIGMWAFAIFNTTTKQLFASRDRFGIKPFYYTFANGTFCFASEIKALKKSPYFSNDLNINQVGRGLQMGWLGYNDETYFQCVSALPAAHNLMVHIADNQIVDIEITRYWDVYPGEYSTATFSEKAEQFRELFANSIALHLRADVPVAACLSGGLDSSAIASQVMSSNPGVSYKSFSIYYDGDGEVDERPFIRKVLEKYPDIEAFYKQPSEAEISGSFHRALFHADAPATGSSFLSQYFLMQLIAANGIKVVLDGQGSDEYLGGYMHSYYRLIADLIRQGSISKALKTTQLVASNLHLSGAKKAAHFSKSLLSSLSTEQRLYAIEYQRYYPFLLAEKPAYNPFLLANTPGTRLDSFLYNLLFTTSLPSLLQYEDRNSMAFSIESRVPFLDHRLVEFAFSLQNDDRINGLETKRILRTALSGIMPSEIVNRRDKKGFVTPGETKWLRGPLSHLLDIHYENLPFLRKDVTERIIKAHKAGDNSLSTLVWRIATLNYWINNFV